MYNVYLSGLRADAHTGAAAVLRFSPDAGRRAGNADNADAVADHPDFETVLRQYHKRVYNLIYRLLPDRDEAADITQEVFLKAYKGYPRFKGNADMVYPWLCRIVVRACSVRFRELGKRNRYEVYSLDEPIDPAVFDAAYEVGDISTDPAGIFQSKAMEEVIQSAIDNLSPEFRVVVVLRDMQGLTYKEISEATGASVELVKIRIYRAREILRRRLSSFMLD